MMISKVQILGLLCVLVFAVQIIKSQSTGFTFQGSLQDNGIIANGNFDFEFVLFDAVSGGDQTGSSVVRNGVEVTAGAFAVQLDFGNHFPGADRYLEIRVRRSGGAGFATLSPRQRIGNAPYAVRSQSALNADNAINAQQLGGLSAGQYILTGDARLSDARAPLPNSPNYIQNSTAAQPSSNFNISGDGTAGGTLSGNTVNTVTQYNIGGNRILSNAGTNNLIAGVGAGSSNTSGNSNSFYGHNAGTSNTTGTFNSFFGALAGNANTTGGTNSFFGLSSGLSNTTGFSNSFFGRSAGDTSTTGFNNSFFGTYAGSGNTSGSYNSFFGAYSNASSGNLTNATAIGYRARVGQSDSLVLGSINGLNGATADTKVGIGTSTPSERLHVVGNTQLTGNLNVTGALNATLPAGSPSYIQNSTTTQVSSNFNVSGNGTVGGRLSGDVVDATTRYEIGGFRVLSVGSVSTYLGSVSGPPNPETVIANTYAGFASGSENQTGSYNSFFGANSGRYSAGSNNSFFGYGAGYDATSGSGITLIGYGSRGAPNLANATAIGYQARVEQSDSLVLGNLDTRVGIGTTMPADRLHVIGSIRFSLLGTAGTVALCRNGSNQISSCSSSARYKSNIKDFSFDPATIRRLRPVTFRWKDSGAPDIGLVAEEVAEIEPLLVTYNTDGKVEGVKYDRLGVLLLNVVKQQQAEIERQRKEIDGLKTAVCLAVPDAPVCR